MTNAPLASHQCPSSDREQRRYIKWVVFLLLTTLSKYCVICSGGQHCSSIINTGRRVRVAWLCGDVIHVCAAVDGRTESHADDPVELTLSRRPVNPYDSGFAAAPFLIAIWESESDCNRDDLLRARLVRWRASSARRSIHCHRPRPWLLGSVAVSSSFPVESKTLS